jgi:FkbH-like protein
MSAGLAREAARRRGRVKCVVWDLDNTLWDGVLLEGDGVRPRPAAVAAIRALDGRGILHSVASRNDADAALAQLEAFGLADLFLHPQISWGPKSEAVAEIARALNIGLDAIAFVDDQEFELEEVAFALPDVLCVPTSAVDEILDAPEFSPRFVTDESRQRRAMYRSAIQRDRAELGFGGTGEDFLRTLDMKLTIAPAAAEDLKRAEELTLRTNQLNSTGVTYSYEDLQAFRTSSDHLLLVASLRDRFGSYGKIGLALADTSGERWRLKLLLMSCRVMSRGVGTVMLGQIVRLAREQGRELEAEFIDTGRNRMMYVTYRFLGFRETDREGDVAILCADPDQAPTPPDHLQLELVDLGS